MNLETLKALKAQLPDDYTIFHGVHWSREYAAWTHFGEIDFVVLNRSGDVLFIEQKNGSLEESAAGLVKRYGQSEKNVAGQIHRSVDKVRKSTSGRTAVRNHWSWITSFTVPTTASSSLMQRG